MPLLHAIQKDRGFLTNEVPEWVAGKLGMEPIQVLSVITFYPFFRQHRIGKRHIRVCRTLSCAMAGGAGLRQDASEFDTDLNEISPDGEDGGVCGCLASCGSAPVMLVDDELHENLDEEKAKAICDQIKSEAV